MILQEQGHVHTASFLSRENEKSAHPIYIYYVYNLSHMWKIGMWDKIAR